MSITTVKHNPFPPSIDLFSDEVSHYETVDEEVYRNATVEVYRNATVEATEHVASSEEPLSALDVMSFDLSDTHAKKPYIPFVKGSDLAPPWANNFLDKLFLNGGFMRKAAEAADMAYSTVWAAQQRLPSFAEQVENIRDYCRDYHLDGLEAVSVDQAYKPGSMPERAMQLKRLSPLYRDRGKNEEPTKINVTVGINIPQPDYNRIATDVQVE